MELKANLRVQLQSTFCYWHMLGHFGQLNQGLPAQLQERCLARPWHPCKGLLHCCMETVLCCTLAAYLELWQAEADVWPQQHLPEYLVMPDG